MWILYLSLGILITGLYSKKGQDVIKFSKILIETIQNRNKPQIKIENEMINSTNTIKYGDLHLNSINSTHHYDVICFTSDGIEDDVIHNINPNNKICEKIPIVNLRVGPYLATIPFRPKDLNHSSLFLAIKHLSCDVYSVYKFKNSEYINILDISLRYEKDLKDNENDSLAETYD